MKCDKLKAEPMIINEDYKALYYPKGPVDAAIAELKQKLAEKESWVKMLGEGEAALSLELEKTKQKLEDARQKRVYATRMLNASCGFEPRQPRNQ